MQPVAPLWPEESTPPHRVAHQPTTGHFATALWPPPKLNPGRYVAMAKITSGDPELPHRINIKTQNLPR